MNNLITINNVRVMMDGTTAMINLEDAARGLGIIKKDIKNGVTYERIHNQNLKKWLIDDFGFMKSEEKLPDFIPENVFYKLCMKANNDTARKFQDLVCDEILPQIRKTGGYIPVDNQMSDLEIMARALQITQNTIAQKDSLIADLERTKAHINDKKVASVMGKLGGITRHRNQLLTQVDELKSKYEYPMHTIDLGRQQFFSVNNMYVYTNNRVIKSPAYNAWNYKFKEADLIAQLAKYNVPSEGMIRYKLSGVIRNKFDLDNVLKSIQDKLAECLGLSSDLRLQFDGFVDIERTDFWIDEEMKIMLEVR